MVGHVPRIAYFGPPGTFTEQAARSLAGDDDELDPIDTVPDVLSAVRTGDVDAACVPVENSVEGAVFATLDSLAEAEALVTVAEAVLPVRFSVLARSGVPAEQVRTVTSHPHALAQVRQWLSTNLPHAKTFAATSTSAAAVAVQRGEFDAAVTAPVAVSHYPLDVLATDVADVSDALTRFLLLRRPGALPAPTGHDRTSLVAVTDDRIGALSDLLVELALRGINLSRIESRPTKGKLGEYRFFMDFDGHIAEPRVGDALSALHRRCSFLRFLGSYPKANGLGGADAGSEVAAQIGTTESAYTAAKSWLNAVLKGETA
jgi:prephenate dehydratase